MAKSADIVFGPYNYILDPFIASQRELDLSDNVSFLFVYLFVYLFVCLLICLFVYLCK